MDTQKEVFKQLFKEDKVELSAERVELALIDDIRSEMATANKGAIKGIDMIEAAKKPLENSLRDNKSLVKKLERTKKSAIEIGASEILREVQKFEQQVKENIKAIDKILGGL